MQKTPEILELVVTNGASVRLQNALKHAYTNGMLKIFTRQDYLSSAVDGVPQIFNGIPNLGRKSLTELDEIVRGKTLHVSPHVATVCDEDFPKQGSADDLAAPIAEDGDASMHEALHTCLSEREQWILERRYGLIDNATFTLDELGRELGVTRERIRQIEAKAIKKLRGRKAKALSRFLDRQKDCALELLFADRLWISAADIGFARAKLGGESVLAIEASCGSVETWLGQNTVAYRQGWLSPSLTVGVVEPLAYGLDSIIQSKRTLMPVATLASNLHASIAAVCAAIDIHPLVKRHLGVMCVAPIGIRTRRAISLLRGMTLGSIGEVFPLNELVTICMNGDPRATHSARDVAIVLAQHKHLFINCFDNGWTTTIRAGAFEQFPAPEELDQPPVTGSPQGVADNVTVDVPTNKSFLISLLKHRGPMFLKDITEEFVAADPVVASRSSVGPTLLVNDEFVRLAPHVYALSSDWITGKIKAADLDRLLLDEFQCAIYVQARWAGESKNLYPSWTNARELAWARWALSCGRTSLLNSLLAVVDPQTWPAGSSEIKVWVDRKMRNGSYSLHEKLSVRLEETIPSFLDFLAASLWAQQQGHISWIGVNRTTGCRVNDRHAAATLALLVHHGIVEAPMHWQMSHRFKSTGSAKVGGLLDHVASGDDGWPKEPHNVIADIVQSSLNSGWLSGEDSSILLERYKLGSQLVDNAEPESTPADELLAVLRERHRNKLIDSLL